ncbi:MAG: ATP-binding cassette domain-containing protein [Hyphomicrobiales bacterium]
MVANEKLTFALAKGEIRCVIGPNGAGKTTFISMISGHLEPTAGRILFKDRDITGLSVPRRGQIGIGRKFQTPSVFEGLSALQNLELAALCRTKSRAERERAIDSILDTIRLVEQRNMPAQFLSHGQRQWLEIGLLLANEAELLLLDEPTAGMTAEETDATGELVHHLALDRSLSVIIIEHDINFIRELDAAITVLHLGRLLRDGTFDEIAQDAQVREVYLGTPAHA